MAKPLTDKERAERRARVERAEPTDEAKAIYDRYVAGGLTVDETTEEILALNARKFGPVHVSGD